MAVLFELMGIPDFGWLFILAAAIAIGVVKFAGSTKIRNYSLIGAVILLVLGGSLGSVTPQSSVVGDLTLTMSNGLSNVTTSEDYLTDDKQHIDIYSADANIADGEEYSFNVTIERSSVTEAAAVKVTCTAPDKIISGTTEKSLIQRTNDKIDCDINDGGTHTNDGDSITRGIAFARAALTAEVMISCDHEEDYHDAMVDMTTSYTISCDVDGVPFSTTIKANS